MSRFAFTPLRHGAAAIALAAAGFGASCMSFATAAGTASEPPLACEIRITEGASGRTLEAFVTATRPVAGSFTLDITRSGANQAVIRQSGEFAAAPGAPDRLGQMTIDRGGHLDAVLDLHWEGRRLTCRSGDPIDL